MVVSLPNREIALKDVDHQKRRIARQEAPMDRATLEQFLADAEDHLDAATRQLERQARLVAQLKEGGLNTRLAEALLVQFEKSYQTFLRERDLIARSMRASALLPPGNRSTVGTRSG